MLQSFHQSKVIRTLAVFGSSEDISDAYYYKHLYLPSLTPLNVVYQSRTPSPRSFNWMILPQRIAGSGYEIVLFTQFRRYNIVCQSKMLKPRLHEQILCGNFCVTNIMDRVDWATNNC